MKRRAFLKQSIAITVAASLAGPAAGHAASAGRKGAEYYEFRVYRLKSGASAEPLLGFLKNAAIPALGKIGAGPVGVFTEIETKDPALVFVLIPYPAIEDYARGTLWLQTDSSAREAALDYVETPKDKAAFDRIDVWLMLAFAGMPKMELPECSKRKKDRIFELRTYESHSESKAAKKVAMFNDGEIDIMRETGLAPVFYGEAIAGPNLPHLTYMTSAENAELHKKHWDAFVNHPKWEQMKNDPKYADTVSKITKWFLKPAPFSEI